MMPVAHGGRSYRKVPQMKIATKPRHAPVSWQHHQLVRKLQGHYAYYGIPGNLDALRLFRLQVIRRWRKWLGRRSHRARWRWERFTRFLIRYPLPQAKIVHATPAT